MPRASELLGRAFEQRVEAQCAQLPVWVKVPNPRTVSGRPTAPVWLDYLGARSDGRCVTADAKWRPTQRRATASLLEPHQRVWADKALAGGVLVVVIVGWMDDHNQVQVSVLPWQVVRDGADLAAWTTQHIGKTLEDL